MNNPVYSLIIPVYNEEAVLPKLKKELDGLLPQLGGPFEVIMVNDGSRDQSLEIVRQWCDEKEEFKVIHFSRNFGHQAALSAGLDYASGKAIIIIDADLQDPPEVILDFIKKWQEGFDVVYGVRKSREGESWFKKITASWFYKLITRLSKVEIPANTSDFRLLDHKVVRELRRLNEQHLFWRGLVPWVGFKQVGVEFVRKPRAAGTTHYPFRKMLKFAIDGITSFSAQPLRISTYIGFIVAIFSFLIGLWAIVDKIFLQATVPGWASIMTVVMFLGGIQLITIGILGEYMGRIYEETKKRPTYVIRDSINLKSKI